MSRRVVWLQLLIGWLPAWGLFTALIVIAHGLSHAEAALIALRSVASAAALGLLVPRLSERFPWKSPVSVTFVAMQCVFAIAYSLLWLVLNSILESVSYGTVIASGPSLTLAFVTGIWLYLMIAGVSYTSLATERAARAEATAVRTRLASLRAQLNPHFLFNALHSVVQLIPQEPKRAAQAAEQLAALLRTTIEEDREIITVGEELEFVDRYLALERMRFGDRLLTQSTVSDDARTLEIPCFAVQTLVENAIRHGASRRFGATSLTINCHPERSEGSALVVTVTDAGESTPLETPSTPGTGLDRLRERLVALYGDAAKLEILMSDASCIASVRIPEAPDAV